MPIVSSNIILKWFGLTLTTFNPREFSNICKRADTMAKLRVLIICFALWAQQMKGFELGRIEDSDYILSLSGDALEELVKNETVLELLSPDTLFDLIAYGPLNDAQNSFLRNFLKKNNKDLVAEEPLSPDLDESVSDLDFLKDRVIIPDLGLKFMSGSEIARILNDYTESQISFYIKDFPADELAYLASKPGMIAGLKSEKIYVLSKRVDVLSLVDEEILLDFAKRRPELLSDLPLAALDALGKRSSLLASLKEELLQSFLNDQKLSVRLSRLSEETLKSIVLAKPDILIQLARDETDPHHPLRIKMMEYLKDEHFLKKVPLRIHSFLAEDTDFRKFISSKTEYVLTILSSAPRLPSTLNNQNLEYYGKLFLSSKGFLERLPCSVIITGARNSTFVNRLSSEILGPLVRNYHLLHCLPEPVLASVIQDTNIGVKLKFRDLLSVIKKVSSIPRLRTRYSIWRALCCQIPKMAMYYFKLWN